MTASLIKCRSTYGEIMHYEMMHGTFYKEAVGEWAV
jgi:hypothetical protein